MNKSCVAARAALLVVCLFSAVSVVSAQSVPAPWSARDIGGPTLTGTSSSSNGVFSIEAAGYDIWKTSDEFHFVYQPLTGDVDIRARIDDVTKADVWSKAGVMIRGSLEADAAHAYALVSAAGGTAFQRRQADGGRSTHTSGPSESAPYWVRLARVGTTVTAYTSMDGATWKAIASDTINLGSTVYVGLAVTSHDTNMRTWATISQVNVGGATAPPPPPPAGGLPQGQANADIGAPPLAGSVSHSNGDYTIRGSGADIWGAADQFHYLYQPVSGDVDVTARVTSMTARSRYAKAGVMIRESLAAGSRHAFMMIRSKGGYAFERRVQPDTFSSHTDGGSGVPPGWVRLVRKGDVVTAYRSIDGATWTTIGSETIPMSATVYVGLGVTSHDPGSLATAIFDNLKVTGVSGTSNNPPAVILSSPASGATYQDPATITFNASATDSDGTVERVEFFANGSRLGSDATAPYSFTSSLRQGTYTLTAVAIDDAGVSTVSDPVSITVTTSAAVSLPESVVFTASADHSTLVVKYVLEIYAPNATPGQSAPLARSDLGKPVPSSTGDITVDRTLFFQALAPGNYLAAVSAVAASGSSRSTAVSFTR